MNLPLLSGNSLFCFKLRELESLWLLDSSLLIEKDNDTESKGLKALDCLRPKLVRFLISKFTQVFILIALSSFPLNSEYNFLDEFIDVASCLGVPKG